MYIPGTIWCALKSEGVWSSFTAALSLIERRRIRKDGKEERENEKVEIKVEREDNRKGKGRRDLVSGGSRNVM